MIIQTFLVDAFSSGKKSWSKVIAIAKGTKIVALLKRLVMVVIPFEILGKVTQIFTEVLSCAWSIGCALVASQALEEC